MPYTPEQVEEINRWYKERDEQADRDAEEADALLTPNAGQFKGKDGQWHCKECKQQINSHLDTCVSHQGFMAWYRKTCEQNGRDIPRPWWMCKGCDQPEEGSHRFGCHIRGARGTQITLSVTRDENGRFRTV